MLFIVRLWRKYLRLFDAAFPAGQLHDIGSIISAGASLVGGLLGSDATQSAAETQAGATRAGIDEQRRQFDLSRQDQAPFRNTGVAANARLAYLLGLNTSPNAATSAMTSTSGTAGVPTTYEAGQSNDPVWEDILGQFNASHAASYGAPMNRPWTADADAQRAYQSLVEQYNARKAAEQAQSTSQDVTAAPGGDYGSLLRKFGLSDLEADPVYQTGLKFGLDTGTNAINQRAIAGGGYNSGSTLKALTRYGTDYGSTKANEAYNRYNNDQTNIYNRLAGISGTGQTATNQIQAAGANATNNITDLTTQAGNARAAGIVGGANAWGNALTGIGTTYQNNQILKALQNGGSRNYYGGGTSSGSYVYDPAYESFT